MAMFASVFFYHISYSPPSVERFVDQRLQVVSGRSIDKRYIQYAKCFIASSPIKKSGFNPLLHPPCTKMIQMEMETLI